MVRLRQQNSSFLLIEASRIKRKIDGNSYLINRNLTKECDCMKRQLQGIALILVSILLMLGYGNVAFFDLSFKWALIFSVIGITGVIMTFLPDKK